MATAPALGEKNGIHFIATVHAGLASTVYKVKINDHIYAAKKYRRSQRDELLAERSVLSTIAHENIVALVPVRLENTLVVEWHGTDLRNILSRGRPCTPISVLHQVLRGLEYLHRRSIVHCDIKPENILISEAEQVKIADFASARPAGAENRSLRNTACYSPLEILLGIRTVDPSMDMWAAGCVFYELVLGKQPFTGSSAFSVISQILEVLGSPTEEDYRGLDIRHIGVVDVFAGARPPSRLCSDELHNSILLGMLSFDPRRRAAPPDVLGTPGGPARPA